MTSNVPFLDLEAQYAEVAAAVAEDLDKIFAKAGFIGGPHVASFEEEYAAFVRTKQCVGVANGTDAIELTLRALDIGPGDEVIIPANTFVATAEAVMRAGATPVLVDVDEAALLMDPQQVENALTSRTRAIVPVHLYGQMAPMDEIAAVAPGIPLVEDAAQSHGATRHGKVSGSVGVAAATSFYPGKNLGAAGDAGAVTTSDMELARRIRLLGNHGSQEKYKHEILGFNSRLDALQAVVLHHKLGRLREWNRQRRLAASRYNVLLADYSEVQVPETLSGNDHVWHLYVIRVPERDRIFADLSAHGIGVALHYPAPIHLLPPFMHLGYTHGDFPIAERAASRLLSLPMFPHLNPDQQERVTSQLTARLGR